MPEEVVRNTSFSGGNAMKYQFIHSFIHGNLFQVSEATDENDLDLAKAVFREVMHIDKEEEDRRDSVSTVGQGQRDRMAAGNAIP